MRLIKTILKKVTVWAIMGATMMTMGSGTVFAAENESQIAQPRIIQNKDNSITFSGLDNIKMNQELEQEIRDKNGDTIKVGIQLVETPENLKHSPEYKATPRATSWKVSFTGVLINAHFYMTVSNNKVTSVYDDWILIIGGTYDNDTLTKTSTYGKLSFKAESYGSVISGKCWLKGTVTGSKNDINVSWQM